MMSDVSLVMSASGVLASYTKEETYSVTAVVCKPKTRTHARICCRRVYVSLGRAHAHGAFGISRTLRWRSVQHVRRRCCRRRKICMCDAPVRPHGRGPWNAHWLENRAEGVRRTTEIGRALRSMNVFLGVGCCHPHTERRRTTVCAMTRMRRRTGPRGARTGCSHSARARARGRVGRSRREISRDIDAQTNTEDFYRGCHC